MRSDLRSEAIRSLGAIRVEESFPYRVDRDVTVSLAASTIGDPFVRTNLDLLLTYEAAFRLYRELGTALGVGPSGETRS